MAAKNRQETPSFYEVTVTADPWRRLTAVLLQAVKDATGKGHKASAADMADAREWLRSIEARGLAAALDLDEALLRWLSGG